MWYERIDSYLKSIGMTRSTSDYNLYHIDHGDEKFILVVYVDDSFVIEGDEQKNQMVEATSSPKVGPHTLGPITKYLGVEFKNTPHGLFLTQHQYAMDMLKFGMENFKTKHVPLLAGLVLRMLNTPS